MEHFPPDQEWLEMLRRHDQDLYRGNGKPGMTVRTSLLEADMIDVKSYIQDSKGNQRWIIRLIVGVLIIGVLNLLLRK